MDEQMNSGQTTTPTGTQTFPPHADFAANAVVKADIYEAATDHEEFWAHQARELLDWSTPFSEALDATNMPFVTWFADGKLNACENALDRHIAAGNGDRVAIHWEGEPGDSRTFTYAELLDEVAKAANALESLGVTLGDRVAIYLPMIPEAIIAMLACARIGAPHSVVFGGFSAQALRSRILDAEAKVVITADGGYRRGKPASLKPAVDDALQPGGETEVSSSVSHVVVVKRTGEPVHWEEGRDLWWDELMAVQSKAHSPVQVPAEHPLFILYTSGTTGKPKGILHTTGGFLTQGAFSHRAVFDLRPETDVYWCTADIGWITGHSYVAYAPLINGATQVIYEGTPDTPTQERWWEIIEKYGVTILYTAPTVVRTFMKWGDELPERHDLSTLRVLGSVGEPINPEAWLWYHSVVGKGKTPIVDTWWQTEAGAIMISALPGVTATKPGAAQVPLPGIAVDVVDDRGNSVPNGSTGYLVITAPWPALGRTIWGDPQRYADTYWSRFPGSYFAGDGARRDDDGDIWFLGRVDDVMNVAGHRLSTTEIESALVSHPLVAEAAVVGANDERTGQAVVAFVILRDQAEGAALSDSKVLGTGEAETAIDTAAIPELLRTYVGEQIGPIAKPRSILVVTELPKTRSGKIMRRLLRDVAEHRNIGDVTSLADANVMSTIIKELG